MVNLNLKLIIVFIMIFGIVYPACAIDEDRLITSAGKVEKSWKLFFSDKFIYAINFGEYWVAEKVYYKNSFSFDIRRTNSIVSPYKLIFSFKAHSCQNGASPKANGKYYDVAKKWFGYKRAKEALANTSEKDFGNGDIDTYSGQYTYTKGSWIKNWGRAESAGINRHRVEGVSPLHERRSCSIMAPSHASAIREEAAKR